MARNNRHLRELELIKKHIISKQDELVTLLNAEGFNVTQATVSRDIKELKLKKVHDTEKGFRYVYDNNARVDKDDQLHSLFKQAVISINVSLNIIVIKTISGSANAVCALIDKMDITEMLGTVAGDDTLFIVVPENENAAAVAKKLNFLVK